MSVFFENSTTSVYMASNARHITTRLIIAPAHDGYEMTMIPNKSKNTGGDSLSP
jgi:hypothetical protein